MDDCGSRSVEDGPRPAALEASFENRGYSLPASPVLYNKESSSEPSITSASLSSTNGEVSVMCVGNAKGFWERIYLPEQSTGKDVMEGVLSRWPFLKGCSPVLLAVDGKPILPDVSVHLNSNHWISISANLSPDHRESLKTTRPSRIGYRPQKFPASQEPTNVKNRSSPITTSVSPCLDEKTETALKTISAAIKSKKPLVVVAVEAIRSNDVEVLRVMFRNGSLSPNAQLNVQGYTILHLASAAKATAAVEVAVKHGADVNAKTTDGLTSLYVAAGCGAGEVVALLLENRANPNSKTSKGLTPLHHAIQFGHVGIVELLLEAGASPNKRYKHMASPLQFTLSQMTDHAKRQQTREVLDIILTKSIIWSQRMSKTKDTLAHLACRAGVPEVIAKMRADGAIAELWAKNDAGETPMMICCKNGSNECARELLKTKVPIQQDEERICRSMGASCMDADVIRAISVLANEVLQDDSDRKRETTSKRRRSLSDNHSFNDNNLSNKRVGVMQVGEDKEGMIMQPPVPRPRVEDFT